MREFHYFYEKFYLRLNFTKLELDELQNEMSNVIIRGMEKYNDLKNKDKEINFLKPEMTVSKEDLIFVKKKKN